MKRYDIGLGVGHGGFQFGESADGDWVLWADVQQLIKENIVLRHEVRAARTLINFNPFGMDGDLREQWLDAVRATDEFDKERIK